MKLLVLLISLIGYCMQVQAQKKPFVSTYSFDSGRYELRYFADSIIRISYHPHQYRQQEQISDAVLLQPAIAFKALPLRVEGDRIWLNNRLLIAGVHHTGNHRGFRIALQESEMIFGGGERALPLNRRGYRLPLNNNPWYGYAEGADNLNYSVPFFTSSKGYGLFFDNPSQGYVDIGKKDAGIMEYGASSGALHLYLIIGNYRDVLQSFHRLTGTQPLPPRWAFGNLMSRFGYTSEAQVKEILQRMDQERVPVDAVIYDLFWFGDSIKGTLGNLAWVNKTSWPDPAGMIRDLKKKNINTILITEPYFVETSLNYKASLPFLAVDSLNQPYYLTNFYFGKGGLLDLFRKDAQQWFWKFYKKQMAIGVEGWWGDLGEPETHPADVFHNLRNKGMKRLFRAHEVHNLYGHEWTKMLYEFYRKEYPGKRLFSLNRSGFAGSQRYGIIPWTGDVSRSWSGLRAQLPALLGMTMSGIPYVHSDAGGFAGGEGDGELYVRWLQFAAFTPIFRPHGTALYEKDTAAFSFPSEAALVDTPYRSHAKKAVDTRYAFLPHNYSLAYQQTRWGRPLMAPLYYHFPDDTVTARIQDQYMWGSDVLVAPIIEKGKATRSYYLPAGSWYHVEQRKFIQGPVWRTDSFSLAQLPLFYREGAFILLNPVRGQNTSGFDGSRLAVTYIPSVGASSQQWYHDDGVSKDALASRSYELISFHSGGLQKNRLLITVSTNGGDFRGRQKNKMLYFHIPQQSGRPTRVRVNNLTYKEHPQQGLQSWTMAPEGVLAFSAEFTGRPLRISIEW